VRAGHAERKAARKAAKKLLRSLAPGARAAHTLMEPGDECLAFLPDGTMALMRLENKKLFRVRELPDDDAATDVAMRWAAEDRAGESVQ
jgi:hypothetical protein